MSVAKKKRGKAQKAARVCVLVMVPSGMVLNSDCSDREVGMDTLPAKKTYGSIDTSVALVLGDCGVKCLDKLSGFELVVGERQA